MPPSGGPAHGAVGASSHYEVRVRGALSPVLLGYLCPASGTATFGGKTCIRLYVDSALDLPDIVGLLAANNVEVLDIRRYRRPAP